MAEEGVSGDRYVVTGGVMLVFVEVYETVLTTGGHEISSCKPTNAVDVVVVCADRRRG